VKTFFTIKSRARGARRAVRRVIPHHVARHGGRGDGRTAPGGHQRPRAPRVTGLAASAFVPAAHGGRPPVRYPGGTARPRLAAVTSADRARAGTAILPALQY
jgi:hypothetical protein